MKIYTKKGDTGETSLIGGTRVPKYHLRIETYGTVDELNSVVGIIRDLCEDSHSNDILKEIQDRLFTLGSSLASDPVKSRMSIPDLKDSDIELLEQEMDRMDGTLPELKNFILPGGHLAGSHCHVARCVCRRAERLAVHLAAEDQVDGRVITYLNRLSDYFFVLARYLGHLAGADETVWNPRQS